jgi:hypothetical protein
MGAVVEHPIARHRQTGSPHRKISEGGQSRHSALRVDDDVGPGEVGDDEPAVGREVELHRTAVDARHDFSRVTPVGLRRQPMDPALVVACIDATPRVDQQLVGVRNLPNRDPNAGVEGPIDGESAFQRRRGSRVESLGANRRRAPQPEQQRSDRERAQDESNPHAYDLDSHPMGCFEGRFSASISGGSSDPAPGPSNSLPNIGIR